MESKTIQIKRFSKVKEIIIDECYANLFNETNLDVTGNYPMVVQECLFNQKYPKMLPLHRLINNTPKGKDTDHINHNPLDNRRENLRSCTAAQNSQNRYRGTNTGFHSVHMAPNGFVVNIEGKKTFFDDVIEAAKFSDNDRTERYGEFAFLNFPNDVKRDVTYPEIDYRVLFSPTMLVYTQVANPDFGRKDSKARSVTTKHNGNEITFFFRDVTEVSIQTVFLPINLPANSYLVIIDGDDVAIFCLDNLDAPDETKIYDGVEVGRWSFNYLRTLPKAEDASIRLSAYLRSCPKMKDFKRS